MRKELFLSTFLFAMFCVQPAIISSKLHRAVRKKDFVEVENLIKGGADVNEKDKFGYTPLHLAVTRPLIKGNKIDMRIIEDLVKRGAKIDAQNKKGDTPLHLAVSNPVIVNTKKEIRESSRMLGRWSGEWETTVLFDAIVLPDVVSFLIAQRAKTDIKNKDGRVPLDIARGAGYNKIKNYEKKTTSVGDHGPVIRKWRVRDKKKILRIFAWVTNPNIKK